LRFLLAAALASTALLAHADLPPFEPDPPKNCADCAGWNAPREPFKLFGNTYYVGTAGLSSILVTSPKGHVLLDGALPESAASIDASIRKLGFRTEDVKLILSSHAHFDHAGGIRALQRASGARVAASPRGAEGLRAGLATADDPQFALGPAFMGFPAVKDVQEVKDGETLRVGDLAITARFTPGHTPGATTWTWRSCEGARCLDMVYADSLTSVSADGFRYLGDTTRPSIADSFRRSIDVVRNLPCDIMVSTHPGFSGLDEKLEKAATRPAENPFLDPGGCRAYADSMEKRLDARLATEAKDVVGKP
jgi:metallo-beta-lactamase class B